MDASLPNQIPEVKLSLPISKQEYLNLIVYLQSPNIKQIKLTDGKILSREDIIQHIVDAVKKINIAVDLKYRLDPLSALESLKQGNIDSVFKFFQSYIKQTTLEQNRPNIDQLALWIEQMTKAQAEQTRPEEIPQLLDLSSIETQIKFIQRLNRKTEKIIGKEQAQILSESISQNIISQHQALGVFGEKPNPKDPRVVWEMINRACDENNLNIPLVGDNTRIKLSQIIADTISPDDPKKLINAQKEINKISSQIVSRDYLIKQVKNFGFPPDQAEKIVSSLEALYPQGQATFTSRQIEKAISLSINRKEERTIKARGLSTEKIAEELSFPVNAYYQSIPVIQAREKLKLLPSKQAKKLIEKLKKEELTIEDFEAERLLRGFTFSEIEKNKKEWSIKNFAVIQRIENKINNIKEASFFRRLFSPKYIKQIQNARRKAKLFDFLATINPLSSGFYKYSILKPRQFLETKISAVNQYLEFSEKEYPRGISGFFKKKRWGFYKKRLEWWKGKVGGIKSSFWRKALYALPNASHLSWWTGMPYRWIRQGTSTILTQIGTKFAAQKTLQASGELLKKAGNVLLNEGFKKLVSKGVGYIAGAIFGLGTGGITTVIAITSAGVTAGITVLKILFSPDIKYKAIRESIKKLASPIIKLVSGAIIGLYTLIKLYSTTFLLAGAGAFLGPMGAFTGGVIGFTIDKFKLSGGFGRFFSPVKTAISAEAALAGKAPGLAKLVPAAAETAAGGFLSSLSNLFPAGFAIAVPTGIGIFTVFTLAAQQASFVGQAGVSDIIVPNQPSESKYIKIEKIATPSSFENSDLTNTQIITYTIKVTPKTEKPLTNLQITDTFSFDSNGSPPPITSTLNPSTFPKEISGETPPFEYSITISGSGYHDTRIRNTFTLTASVEGKTDSVSAFANVEIGNPPVPTSVSLAQAIVEALMGCSGLEPYNESLRKGVIITRNNWNIAKTCLEGVAGSASIIKLFEYGVNKWGHPQCVGFVMGLGLYAPGSGEGNADDYCNHPSLQTDTAWDSLEVGDFVAEDFDTYGHVAIVTERSGDIIWLAEAMGDTGRVQLRQIGLAQLRQKYCGFLRSGGTPAVLLPSSESTPTPEVETPETPEGYFTCCYDEKCHLCSSSCSSERLYIPEEACIMGTGGYCGAGPINHLCWAHSYYLPPMIPENHFWCCNDVDEKWRVCGQNCDSGYWVVERACERHHEKFEPCLEIVFE